jgi:hypothetical protein
MTNKTPQPNANIHQRTCAKLPITVDCCGKGSALITAWFGGSRFCISSETILPRAAAESVCPWAQGSGDFGTVTLTFARPFTPARPFVARLSKPGCVFNMPQPRKLKLPPKNRACGKEKPQAVYTLGARGVCCLNLGSLGRAAGCRGMGSRPVGLKPKICSAFGSCNAASRRNVNRCGRASNQTSAHPLSFASSRTESFISGLPTPWR